MLRRIVWFIPILLMAGYAFWGLEWTDYQKGYRQAVRDAKQAEQQMERMDWVRDVGGELLQSAEPLPIPSDSTAGAAGPLDRQGSEDWREGYRRAVRDLMTQPNR